MDGIIIDFGEKETTKKEFYSNDKKKININDINIKNINFLENRNYFLE